MGEILSLNTHIQNKTFSKTVLPFFTDLNPHFNYYREEEQSVFFLKAELYLFVFLRFIPPSVETALPTLESVFEKMDFTSRISTGEWVIDCVYEFDPNKSNHLLKDIHAIKNSGVYHFVEKVLNQ